MPPSSSAITASPTRNRYSRKRSDALKRSRALVAAGQELPRIPPPANPARRAKALASFRFFCEAYFPELFYLPWSADHLKILDQAERTVRDSLMFAIAMPRGSGKTAICLILVLWAVLTGLHKSTFLVNSTGDYALDNVENLKTILRFNDLLAEDFPEVCLPIRELEGEARKCIGQKYCGRPTGIVWKADRIVLPTIPGSKCSGAVIRSAGIEGNIRGSLKMSAEGTGDRPTLVIVDDPQTDESARSESQCASRLKKINTAIGGLAGPGKRVAILIPCTVICRGDVADTILDRTKNPQWQGERTKFVYAWPLHDGEWEEYHRVRISDGPAAATLFYRDRQARMDEGSIVAWPERHEPEELSALQHAYNLRFDLGDAAFFAEYQNEPIDEADAAADLTSAQIANKLNGLERLIVPADAQHVTAYIDVQEKLLYYVVAAWSDDFTGAVIHYGAWPDPQRQYFTLRETRRTLKAVAPGAGIEGAIHAGLTKLVQQLVDYRLQRTDGTTFHVERILIDCQWGEQRDLLYNFCATSPHAGVLLPSHGRGIKGGSAPMAEWKKNPGDKFGHHWIISGGKARERHVTIDTNYWKSFIHARLSVAIGDRGCLSLFSHHRRASERIAADHRMFGDHCTAEKRVRVHGRGRDVDEWSLPTNRPDNHLFDCVTGAAVAASTVGCALPTATKLTAKKKWTVPAHLLKKR